MKTTAEILQAHVERMNDIASEDIRHTQAVQGAIRQIAERSVLPYLQVSDLLETQTEPEATK